MQTGLFRDSDFTGDLEDSKSTSGGTLQCVALIGALFFFFKKMAVSVALNGAGCAGSVAMLHHLVPARIPYKSREKHVFWSKNVCGRDKSRSVCCA